MIYKGFSLVELMVVVAIIGIIAAVSFPAYQGYIQAAHQGQAEADVKICSLAVERFSSNSFSYAGAGSGVCSAVSPEDGDTKFTIVVLPNTSGTDYTITATPVSGWCGDVCVEYSLTADGTETRTTL